MLVYDRTDWSLLDYSVFCGLIQLGILVISDVVPAIVALGMKETLPVRGINQHLDKFTKTDWIYIWINKMITCVFIYNVFQYVYAEPLMKWGSDEYTFINTGVALLLMYIVYDFFYTLFHGFLHIPILYGHVHKHHHAQKAPSRGYLDGSNVHPFEFIIGEYNHLATMFIVTNLLGGMHIAVVIFFILLDGFLAPMNHTRYDMVIRLPFMEPLWAVKYHDVHHRIPRKNFGQYTMFWDKIFGSYEDYTEFTGTPIQFRKAKET